MNGFRTVANSCIKELSLIKENGREIWTDRLEAFLEALKEVNLGHEFNGLDAISIIDLDRLKVLSEGKPKLEAYIQTLPPIENNPAKAHAQHLKVIALIVPVIADFA